MIHPTLQRGRLLSRVALSAAVAVLMSASVSNAQSSYQITDYSGNLLPAAVGIYTVSYTCYNAGGPPMPAQICSWLVRRLYGSNYPVVVVIDAPHGNPPGCYAGYTQQIDSGYSRSGCAVFASAAVYGVN